MNVLIINCMIGIVLAHFAGTGLVFLAVSKGWKWAMNILDWLAGEGGIE